MFDILRLDAGAAASSMIWAVMGYEGEIVFTEEMAGASAMLVGGVVIAAADNLIHDTTEILDFQESFSETGSYSATYIVPVLIGAGTTDLYISLGISTRASAGNRQPWPFSANPGEAYVGSSGANFGNTARFSLVLPSNVTVMNPGFTAFTGVNAEIPEPGTYTLVFGAMVLLGVRRRK
jgi:hypothetical protein